jgi:glutaredoxin
MPSRPRVTLYTRPDCHLCDQARAALESLRRDGAGFELEEIDIESDDELHARFLERIPVIELDGELVGELGLDADEIRSRLGTLSG